MRLLNFNSWRTASGTGADLLWRVKDNLMLEVVEDLHDGWRLVDVSYSRRSCVRCDVHLEGPRAISAVSPRQGLVSALPAAGGVKFRTGGKRLW